MAKVKSMPSGNFQNLVLNDALTNAVSLELCDESPSSYGVNLLLNGDRDCFYQQLVDKGNTNKNETVCVESSQHHISGNLQSFFSVNETCVHELLQEGSIQKKNKDLCKKYLDNSVTMPPITSNCGNMVKNSYISLSSLAQNHLNFDKKPQVLKDSCLDLEFTLEDLLSDIDGSSVTNKSLEPANANANSNSCSLSFSTVKNDKLERRNQEEVFDDLSVLLDSSETHQQPSSFSLADLANNHFLNNLPSNSDEYLNENSPSVNTHGCENSDDSQYLLLNCLGNEFSPTESEVNLSKVKESLPVALNRNSADVDESDNASYNCNVTDDEIEPDINLSFCIKKPKNVLNDISTVVSVSPESSDSGFDEIDSLSIKCIPSFQDFVSVQSTCPCENDFKSPLTNPNPSLLSKAISCKSKLDKTKCEMLKKVRKALYCQMIETEFLTVKVSHVARLHEITDQSNQCVISSEVTD